MSLHQTRLGAVTLKFCLSRFGAVQTISASLAGGNWSAEYAPSEAGDYGVVVRMTDAADNTARKSGGTLVVTSTPTLVGLNSVIASPVNSLLTVLIVAVMAAVSVCGWVRRR